MSEITKPLLEVKNLKTYFYTEDGVVRAVDGVDFEVYPGEVLGIVGESGCGKSVTSLSIMRLIGIPGKIVEGEIVFDGKDLVKATEEEMMQVRGNRISMIFQQPQSALNPVFRAGDQISEVLNIHQDFGREAGRERAVELLKLVGIPEPERRADAFPHELSGGMSQRVMIAMALACVPDLLIADEPTTALDVTIQAQILELVKKLRDQFGMAIIWISHDLGVVAGLADTVQVMYGGMIVERGPVMNMFKDTRHPYTLGLLKSLPRHDMRQGGEKLTQIEGAPPDMRIPPKGCPFFARCTYRLPGKCDVEMPPLVPGEGAASNHLKACWVDVRTAVQTPLNEGVALT